MTIWQFIIAQGVFNLVGILTLILVCSAGKEPENDGPEG